MPALHKHPYNHGLTKKIEELYGLRSNDRVGYADLLAGLGNPHLCLPPTIHVAGTNGKGSVVAILRAIFEAAGLTVHAFTSPHLHCYNERILCAGKEITDDELESLLDEVMEKKGEQDLHFFEISSAIAFLAFSRTQADILLLETGLGGRLDCTNVIENKLATIITRISRDHTEILGNSRTQIATEKAGIMKPDTPCIIGKQYNADIMPVFKQTGTELPCPLYRCGEEWNTELKKDGFIFSFNGDHYKFPLPNLTGAHQIENAGIALATIKTLSSLNINEKVIRKGLQNINWPGRLQNITHSPAASLLPSGWELWFDGGHNDSAGEVLANQAALWQKQDGKPLHLIVGMMNNKKPEEFLRPLIPYAETIFTIEIPDKAACFSSNELRDRLQPLCTGKTLYSCSSLAEALEKLAGDKVDSGRIMITGSLYLANTPTLMP